MKRFLLFSKPCSVFWEMPHLGLRAVTLGVQRMALRLEGLTGRDVPVATGGAGRGSPEQGSSENPGPGTG